MKTTNISGWDRMAMAARWLRDHAPALSVTIVTFTALWACIVLAAITSYFFDATFYRRMAPVGFEMAFIAIGLSVRTFLIFGGMLIEWLRHNTKKRPRQEQDFKVFGRKLWTYSVPVGNDYFGVAMRSVRLIWVICLCLSMVAALGFVEEGNDYHRRKNGAVAQTETVTTESVDAQIERLEKEKTAVRADRDRLVAGARASMNLVLDDGRAGNDDVSGYEANIRQYEQDAKAKLDDIDDKIEALSETRLDARTSATAKAVEDPTIPAVFSFPQRYLGWWNPSAFQDAFALITVIVLELIASIGAPTLLSVQMALSKAKRTAEAGAKGGKSTSARQREKMKDALLLAHIQAADRRRSDLTEDTQPDAARDDPRAPRSADPDTDIEEDDDDGDHRTPRQAAE